VAVQRGAAVGGTAGDGRDAADAADPHAGRRLGTRRKQHPVLPGARARARAGRDVSVRARRAWHGDARRARDGVGLAVPRGGVAARTRIAGLLKRCACIMVTAPPRHDWLVCHEILQ
jgi:hypothetical protein